MDVTQRRSLNGLNYSNKNTMNFFYKYSGSNECTAPDCGPGYFPFPASWCMDRPKGFYYGNESEIKQSEHIKLNV